MLDYWYLTGPWAVTGRSRMIQHMLWGWLDDPTTCLHTSNSSCLIGKAPSHLTPNLKRIRTSHEKPRKSDKTCHENPIKTEKIWFKKQEIRLKNPMKIRCLGWVSECDPSLGSPGSTSAMLGLPWRACGPPCSPWDLGSPWRRREETRAPEIREALPGLFYWDL